MIVGGTERVMVFDLAVPTRDHGVEKQRGIRDGARDRAADREAGDGGDAARRRNETPRRLHSDEAARRCRNAYGSTAVAARCEGQHPRGDRGSRSPAGSAHTERPVPGVAHTTGRAGLRVPGETKLRCRRLADAHSARIVEHRDQFVGCLGDDALEELRSEAGRHAASVYQVFVRERKSPEGTRVRKTRLHLVRAFERGILCDSHESADVRVDLRDAPQHARGHLTRRYLALLQRGPEVESGELMDVSHMPRLPFGGRSMPARRQASGHRLSRVDAPVHRRRALLFEQLIHA